MKIRSSFSILMIAKTKQQKHIIIITIVKHNIEQKRKVQYSTRYANILTYIIKSICLCSFIQQYLYHFCVTPLSSVMESCLTILIIICDMIRHDMILERIEREMTRQVKTGQEKRSSVRSQMNSNLKKSSHILMYTRISK